MNKSKNNWDLIGICAAIVIAAITVTNISHLDSKLNKNYADTLSSHNQRLLDLESHSWDIDEVHDRMDSLRNDFHKQLQSFEMVNIARLYTLEITICKTDTVRNTIQKRKVLMENILAVNPKLWTAGDAYVDVWFWYERRMDIPDSHLYLDPEMYTCGLKILSVK